MDTGMVGIRYDDGRTVYGNDLIPVTLDSDDVRRIAAAFEYARAGDMCVCVGIDSEGFKVKVGTMTWSPGMGEVK